MIDLLINLSRIHKIIINILKMEQINRFSKKEALKFGWHVFKNNTKFFISVLLIIIIISFVGSRLTNFFEKYSFFVSFLISLIVFALIILMNIGFIKILLKLHDQEKPEISDLFNHYNLFPKYFVAILIYSLIVLLGLIFLIIPGVIFLIKYYFVEYFVVDKGYGPIQALRQAAKIIKGNWLNFFVFLLILLLINLLTIFTLFLGLFVTIPVTSMAIAYAYRKLSTPQEIQETLDQ